MRRTKYHSRLPQLHISIRSTHSNAKTKSKNKNTNPLSKSIFVTKQLTTQRQCTNHIHLCSKPPRKQRCLLWPAPISAGDSGLNLVSASHNSKSGSNGSNRCSGASYWVVGDVATIAGGGKIRTSCSVRFLLLSSPVGLFGAVRSPYHSHVGIPGLKARIARISHAR